MFPCSPKPLGDPRLCIVSEVSVVKHFIDYQLEVDKGKLNHPSQFGKGDVLSVSPFCASLLDQ